MPFTINRRVEFADTDMAGIMHFSNFFKFMEVAETAFLTSLGYSVSWDEAGIHYGFPRVSASCDYHKPIRFGDEVAIAVTVEKLGTKSIAYRYDFTHDGAKVATGRMTGVFCRSTPGRGIESLDIPDEMRRKLPTGD